MRVPAISLLFLLISTVTQEVSGSSCSADCRPSASCCGETECRQEDPADLSYLTCPCMIPPAEICVVPGTNLVLNCDPGGECLDHCSWDTPQGPCSWVGTTLQCSDPSIIPRLSGGNCELEISSAEYRHSGQWKCKVVPSSHALSDYVNITVSSDCPATGGLGSNWWRTGWTAGLLWSAVALLIIIIIVLIITAIYCFCPVLCFCLPCCDRRREHRQEHHQERVGQYSEVRRDRGDRRPQNNFHEPVVLEDERMQRSGYDPDIFETRNIPDYRAPSQGVRTHHHQEAQYEIPRSVDYQVPRIYASSNSQMRTAKKKSNFDLGLEERIRKASGVARQEHL